MKKRSLLLVLLLSTGLLGCNNYNKMDANIEQFINDNSTKAAKQYVYDYIKSERERHNCKLPKDDNLNCYVEVVIDNNLNELTYVEKLTIHNATLILRRLTDYAIEQIELDEEAVCKEIKMSAFDYSSTYGDRTILNNIPLGDMYYEPHCKCGKDSIKDCTIE